MRVDYTYETERAAIMRLGIGHVHELALAENADRYHAAHGWDLLLDYDRDHDVPGMLGFRYAKVFLSSGEPIQCIEIHDGPPDPGTVQHILAARLKRSGHTITDFHWSNSTNGWHAKLRIDPHPVNPLETVALQSILGSDPLRESCNLQRAREVEAWASGVKDGGPTGAAAAKFWRDRWNVLYRPNPSRRKVRP